MYDSLFKENLVPEAGENNGFVIRLQKKISLYDYADRWLLNI